MGSVPMSLLAHRLKGLYIDPVWKETDKRLIRKANIVVFAL
jgi:hypothetical protein